MSRAIPSPAPFLPTNVIHHSKHHSSKHNNDHHNKHPGHGHSHSHHHSHSHPHRVPSPSPFPITPSASYPVQQSPQFHFPAVPHRPPIQHSNSHGALRAPSPSPFSPHVHFSVPHHHRPPIRSNSSNNLFNAAAAVSGHNHQLIKPPPKHSTKHNTHTNRLTKPLYNPTPTPHPDFQYSKCTGRRKALCVCLPIHFISFIFNPLNSRFSDLL
jgi:hypothetical protein